MYTRATSLSSLYIRNLIPDDMSILFWGTWPYRAGPMGLLATVGAMESSMYTKSATWEGAACVTTRSSPARSGRWLEHSRSNALNVKLRAGSPAASRRGATSTTHTRHVESVHTVKPWPKPCLPHTDQNTPDHAHKPRTGAFISVHLHAPPLMLWSLTRCAGPQKASSRLSESYICRIVDMNFGEFPFHELR
jgi:hypothetical protein